MSRVKQAIRLYLEYVLKMLENNVPTKIIIESIKYILKEL